MLLKRQGQNLLCPQCCRLLVLLCLFSFCACIKGGTVMEDWFGFSAEHLKRGGRQTGYCSLWLSNRGLLVRFKKRKNTVSKNVPWELCSQLNLRKNAVVDNYINLSPCPENSLPSLLFCPVCQQKHHVSVH